MMSKKDLELFKRIFKFLDDDSLRFKQELASEFPICYLQLKDFIIRLERQLDLKTNKHRSKFYEKTKSKVSK